jgi:acyl-CoA thioester hydrolase
MAFSNEIELKVPFHHLDPLQVVWHGNYFQYFDQARFALFDAAGIDLYHYMTEKQLVFPITRTSIKCIAPLGPKASFVCKATITEARYKIAMDFEIRRLPDRLLCAKGQGEQVAVRLPDMELLFEIPEAIGKALLTAG